MNVSIFLSLIKEFFQIGVFSFGGGLATLPFLFDISERYAYAIEKGDGLETTLYCPPIGVSLYYTNNNSEDNGGGDNGGNNNNGNNNDDNNEGGGESGLSDIDVSHLVSISPNPASDIVTVQSSFKVKEMEIYNTYARMLYKSEIGDLNGTNVYLYNYLKYQYFYLIC